MLPSGKHKSEALAIIHRVVSDIGDRPFDAALEFRLNRLFGPCSGTYEALARLLSLGLEEGWVAYAPVEGAGYYRGRIAEPTSQTARLSVESGLLCNVRGQYHCHTRGEIDMIVPIDSGAQFCGHGAGWMVYPPLSEHYPTVTGGKALIMFSLPNGEIEYKAPPQPEREALAPSDHRGQGMSGEPVRYSAGAIRIADVTRFSPAETLP